MANLFQIGAIDSCGGLLPIVKVIRRGVFPLIQWGIPLLLIVLITLDLGKAVISSDEKEQKAAQSRIIKRLIYGALVFFVVTVVAAVMNMVAEGEQEGTDSWQSCWNAAK